MAFGCVLSNGYAIKLRSTPGRSNPSTNDRATHTADASRASPAQATEHLLKGCPLDRPDSLQLLVRESTKFVVSPRDAISGLHPLGAAESASVRSDISLRRSDGELPPDPLCGSVANPELNVPAPPRPPRAAASLGDASSSDSGFAPRVGSRVRSATQDRVDSTRLGRQTRRFYRTPRTGSLVLSLLCQRRESLLSNGSAIKLRSAHGRSNPGTNAGAIHLAAPHPLHLP